MERPSNLPPLPGVYFFKDTHGALLYIGKARNIHKRVSSYFTHKAFDWKITELLKRSMAVEYVVTKTEQEACIIEAQLISTHKPPFNILLTSDTPFLYLVCDDGTANTLPTISITRTPPSGPQYLILGPLLQRRTAQALYFFITKTFALHRCNKSIAQGCLEHHLGICAGSCMPSFDTTAYRERYILAKTLLLSDEETFLKTINCYLAQAIAKRAFEQAKVLSEYKNNIGSLIATLHSTASAYQKDIEEVINKLTLTHHEKTEGLEELQKTLKLSHRIKTIDCIDISHFQGHALVGSCVRFVDGACDTRQLKRYKITTLFQQNDCAAIQEIVRKRYKDPIDLPDVIMIDGGKGQRNAAQTLLPGMTVIALAKREERLHTPINPEGICISPHTAMGRLLIALRDCAHRTALQLHKKRFRYQIPKKIL